MHKGDREGFAGEVDDAGMLDRMVSAVSDAAPPNASNPYHGTGYAGHGGMGFTGYGDNLLPELQLFKRPDLPQGAELWRIMPDGTRQACRQIRQNRPCDDEMETALIRAGAYAVIDSVTYQVRVEEYELLLGQAIHGGPPTSWVYEDAEGAIGTQLRRSSGKVSRLFVVQTWASLDGIDVKVRNLNVREGTAAVEAAWPQGAPEGSFPLHPDLVIVGDRGTGYDCMGTVDVDRLTNVWEWAEVDGPIDSRVRPMTTRWMGEEHNGEPWRRPKLPREKLMWRSEAKWGPWGRIETDPLA